MRAHGLGGQRREVGGRHRYVAFEDRPDAEAGDAVAVRVEEQRRVWLGAVRPLTEIGTERAGGLLPQRADPLFASLLSALGSCPDGPFLRRPGPSSAAFGIGE